MMASNGPSNKPSHVQWDIKQIFTNQATNTR